MKNDRFNQCCEYVFWGFLTFIAVLAFGSVNAHELEVSSVRDSLFEWRCETSDGTFISGHTRQDKAFQSCINAAMDGQPYIVRGGTYRVTVSGLGSTPSPPPEPPPVDPEPDPPPVDPIPPPVSDSVTLSWETPTLYTNGTVMGSGLPDHITIYDGGVEIANLIGAPTTHEVTGLSSGEHCFTTRAWANGVSSDDSNTVCNIIP